MGRFTFTTSTECCTTWGFGKMSKRPRGPDNRPKMISGAQRFIARHGVERAVAAEASAVFIYSRYSNRERLRNEKEKSISHWRCRFSWFASL